MKFPFLHRMAPLLAVLLVAAAPSAARAWWNADYTQRTAVTLNTSAAGVTTTEALSGVAVPLRLHSGNFDFIGAKPDGSDLRVVAGDDKTPLKFAIERFDGTGELAVLWVQVPTVAPGSDKNLVYVYAGNAKAAAEPASPVVDSGALATLRFAEKDAPLQDAGGASLVTTGPVATEPNGLIGASGNFDGSLVLTLPATDRLKAAAGAPYTVSLWARPVAVAGTLFAQGALVIGLDRGKVVVRLGRQVIEGGTLPPSTWVQVGFSLGAGKATLYVNGEPAAQADLAAPAPAIEGPVRIGQDFVGLVDEVQVAGVTRSADWMKFSRAAQGADAKLVAAQQQRADQADEGGGHGSYFTVLFKNLTVDAWVVIIILGVMFLVALLVMVTKLRYILRADLANKRFLARFRQATSEVLQLERTVQMAQSPLYRLYAAGQRELKRRHIGEPGGAPLSDAALNAVQASIDADLARESQKLNAHIVWLTIAISGGPFLGLLGTVVGVMITFAAIAAAGDVNVNAIAPGIAAALLATVAGLGVAIPSLFGYNYLASRIKNLSTDMQIFIDEFITRVAEQYGERGQAGQAARTAAAAGP